MTELSPAFLSNYLLSTFNHLQAIETWGETSFFYNPDGLRPKGIYFCTIKEKNGPNDRASALDRKGVFRYNFGISKPTFLQLFGHVPKRPNKGEIIGGHYDFTKIDVLYPHPIYGWMCWVAILSPSQESFKTLHPLIIESYQQVIQKHENK